MQLANNLVEDNKNYKLVEKIDYLGGDFLKLISECVKEMKETRKECLKVFISEK